MARVRLRGLNQVTKRLSGGRRVTYWYAWKGGPRLEGAPGSPAFMASYAAAHAERRSPARNDSLAGLVRLYRTKPEFQQLSASTRAEWSRWLARLEAHDIGALSYKMLDDRRVKADLTDWRDEYADRPRTADYGVQVLSRVLGFAMKRGILAFNHAAGIEQLYESSRADVIWTAPDIAKFSAATTAPVARAVRLACETGLRRGDLIGLRWRHVSGVAIVKPTEKSLGREVATVPLLAAAKALLKEIGPGEPNGFVLLNSHGRPWTGDGLTHMVVDGCKAAALSLRLHDARGTFATRLRLAGLSSEEIARVLGWKKDRVETILGRYVDQEATVMALVRKVQQNEAGAPIPNSLPTDPVDKS